MTLLDELLIPLTRFAAAVGRGPRLRSASFEPVLVYAGDKESRISGTRVVPWNRVDALDWTPKGRWKPS